MRERAGSIDAMICVCLSLDLKSRWYLLRCERSLLLLSLLLLCLLLLRGLLLRRLLRLRLAARALR